MDYCCERFEESAKDNEIQHCGIDDETEWAIPGFYHLYYCPFCGAFIKGIGWGKYDEKYPPKNKPA